ncbi:hypothetical protein Ancab_037301 [Ancistrocladus abbreviatus]
METVGHPQPWPASSSSNSRNFVDCSHGICNSNCPQGCYDLPPPPPFDYDGGSGSGSRISPLMAALISVLAGAFLLLTYYTVVSKYCKRRRNRRRDDEQEELEARLDQLIQGANSQQQQQQRRAIAASTGLDDRFIKSIAVFKYRRGDGLVEGTDCAVCLNEFKEEENLRLMPNCQHAFHLPCIDTWLKSQSNCPLCRSAMIDVPQAPHRSGHNTDVSAMRIENNRSDVVVIVGELEAIVHHEIPASNSTEGDSDSGNNSEEMDDEIRKEGTQI